jgi:hypothetical protein
MLKHPRRLLGLKAIVAYIIVALVFLDKVVGTVSNVDFVLTASGNSRLVSLWNFFASPLGNLIAIVVTGIWLTLLVVWPSSKPEDGLAVSAAGEADALDTSEPSEQLELLEREKAALEKARDYSNQVVEDLRKRVARADEQAALHYSRAEISRSEREAHNWLYEIAKNDREKIRELVVVENCKPTNFNMECNDAPFIEFSFQVFNASVYPVIINPEVKGRISYREANYPLSGDLRLEESEPFTIEHGQRVIFKLRQVLIPHECELIRRFTKEHPREPYYTMVNTEKVAIPCVVDLQNGRREAFTMRFPSTANLPLCL